MNRIDRLNAILIHLQSKRVVTAREIAERFEITIRTVYRDLRSLEEAGVPIGAEAGIGYFLPDNYRLPPVMFTSEEASALLIGGKLAGKLSDRRTADAYSTALYKIKAIIRHNDKDSLELLDSRIQVFSYAKNQDINLFFAEIQLALQTNKTIRLTYNSISTGSITTRETEPVGLCNYGQNWHLIAYCRLRKNYRDFRLDRIISANLTENTYNARNHPSLNEYFQNYLKANELASIKIKFEQDYLIKIKDSKFWYGFIGSEQFEGETILHFLNNELYGFAKWLLWAGNSADIIEPAELKTIVQQLVNELSLKYQG